MKTSQLLKDIKYIRKADPHLFRDVEKLRLECIEGITEKKYAGSLPWGEWCYIPVWILDNLLIKPRKTYPYMASSTGKAETGSSAVLIAGFVAWRISQGVYVFDEDIYHSIVETPTSGSLPWNLLLKFPEWCIYVETPNILTSNCMGLGMDGSKQSGFWAFWDDSVIAEDCTHEDGSNEVLRYPVLRLILDFKGGERSYISFVACLGESLEEGVRRYCEEIKKEDEREAIKLFLQEAIPLLLYICSANAEYDGNRRPSCPEQKRTKKGGLMWSIPSKPKVWNIGSRIGAAIRKYNSEAENEAVKTKPEVDFNNEGSLHKKHSSPRPHIRRAHWHLYWVGSKRDGSQKTIVKWISQVSVNVESYDALPVTVRPVQVVKKRKL